MSKKIVTFITTVNHNVGDDFVREGLKYLIKQKFPNQQFSFSNIHKHVPITTRFGFETIRNNRIGHKIDKLLPLSVTKDKMSNTDLIIQSGAPFYWCHNVGGGHCWANEWYQPLIQRRYLSLRNIPLLNLAVGTCQKYHSKGDEFCDNCKAYIANFHELAKVTTVRDSLSKSLLSSLNLNTSLIPCSSIFAIDEYNIKSQKGEYIAVNFMEGGAHYEFGQSIDFKKWKDTFSDFYNELKKKERIIFVCHDLKEVKAAKEIDATCEVFYEANDFVAYMNFYSKAKIGIMNRVHGAFLLASLGKPSIIIGNDTRALMAKEIGLKSFFVNDVTKEILFENYSHLIGQIDIYKNEIIKIKKKAYIDYLDKAFEGIIMD
jgi:Polysaccharide pyruvyl transferase